MLFLRTQTKYKLVEGVDVELDGFIADQQASLYNLFYSGFAFLGPILGATLYDAVGYRGTFDIVQFMMYGIGLFYLVFVAGFHAFKDYG